MALMIATLLIGFMVSSCRRAGNPPPPPAPSSIAAGTLR
jgi:hypothetical protein